MTAVDEGGVAVGADRIAARTVIWGAGVTASPLAATLGVPLDRSGRVRVEPRPDACPGARLRVRDRRPRVRSSRTATPLPGVAPAAIQMGHHAAANIRRAVRGEPLAALPLPRQGLAGDDRPQSRRRPWSGRLHLSGLVAWMAWLLIHIFFLIGFRNRLVVLFTWTWAYLTWQRSARLILSYGREPPRLG